MVLGILSIIGIITLSIIFCPALNGDQKKFKNTLLEILTVPFIISLILYIIDRCGYGYVSSNIQPFYITSGSDYIMTYIITWLILSIINCVIIAIYKTIRKKEKIKTYSTLIFIVPIILFILWFVGWFSKYSDCIYYKYDGNTLHEGDDEYEYDRGRIKYVTDDTIIYYYDDSKYYHSVDFCPKLDEEFYEHDEKFEKREDIEYKETKFRFVQKDYKPCNICVPQKGKDIPKYKVDR